MRVMKGISAAAMLDLIVEFGDRCCIADDMSGIALDLSFDMSLIFRSRGRCEVACCILLAYYPSLALPDVILSHSVRYDITSSNDFN